MKKILVGAAALGYIKEAIRGRQTESRFIEPTSGCRSRRRRRASVRTGEARSYLERAIARVKDNDHHLLMVDVSERCIAARLAMYLRDALPAYYDVDVEYNRHGPDKKKLYDLIDEHNCPRDRDDEGQTVLPDVIVHKRGVDNSNLLIIEIKKSANQPGLERDIRRIEAFRAELRYVFGALVVCKTGDDPSIDIEWYE